MEHKPSRSDSYQWKILESITDMSSRIAENFWDNSSALHHQINQEYLELNDKAMARIFEIIYEICTPHQREVVRLLAEGKTQMEVAATLGINQSSVTKAVHGNLSYENDKITKYGGIGKKLKFAILHDQALKDILIQIKKHKDSHD